jgi:hypothetical protein
MIGPRLEVENMTLACQSHVTRSPQIIGKTRGFVLTGYSEVMHFVYGGLTEHGFVPRTTPTIHWIPAELLDALRENLVDLLPYLLTA